MKKTLVSILACAILLCCIGCGTGGSDKNEDNKPHAHSWNPATCTTSKTCQTCGATEGAATGHSWNPATCTTPKTCSVCGKTEGSPVHNWNPATCTAAKTCNTCGATEGKAKGHSWVDATYTNPKTCSVCKVTEGSVLIRETENVAITADNWSEYFEIKRKDIIPTQNAFGEYGTPENMYYNLELVLKKKYSEKLVSIDVSIEFVLDKYLKSYDYDKTTGIGTVTDEYKVSYNNTDTALCNFKNSEKAYICTCHHAGKKEINGKVIYYAYICESVKCTRAAGTLVLQK